MKFRFKSTFLTQLVSTVVYKNKLCALYYQFDPLANAPDTRVLSRSTQSNDEQNIYDDIIQEIMYSLKALYIVV